MIAKFNNYCFITVIVKKMLSDIQSSWKTSRWLAGRVRKWTEMLLKTWSVIKKYCLWV